jgi:hypothetical protein
MEAQFGGRRHEPRQPPKRSYEVQDGPVNGQMNCLQILEGQDTDRANIKGAHRGLCLYPTGSSG